MRTLTPGEKATLVDLEALFKRAQAEGLWFHLPKADGDGVWMTPAELRKANENRLYVIGPALWQLRDPNRLLDRLEVELNSKREEVESVKERMRESGAREL